jgi:hypothetical protein
VSFTHLFGEPNSGAAPQQIFLFAILQQLAQTILQPVLADVSEHVWQGAVDVGIKQVLSPQDLADMVVKNIITQANGADTASMSGVDAGDFDLLVKNDGEPPGLEQVLEWWRRGFIGFDDTGVETPSVQRAVRTSRIYDYWTEVIKQAALIPISVADAVNGVQRGQISQTEGETYAYQNGISNQDFQVLLNTRGNPPSPGELIELYRRGFIQPKGIGPHLTTFEQGIYEGDTKNKWWPLFFELTNYVPPPRTVTTLLSHGAITEAEAQTFFQYAGLAPDLAAAYVRSATSEKLATRKNLAEATVLKLYYDRLVTAEQATPMLEDLGYTAEDVTFLLELEDFGRAAAAYNSAVTRVGTLYVSRKITRDSAVSALQKLDVQTAAVTQMLGIWDAELSANIRTLTESQIADAYKYSVKDQDWCIAKLVDIGYTEHDAWVLISVAGQQAAPNEPADVALAGQAVPTTEA